MLNAHFANIQHTSRYSELAPDRLRNFAPPTIAIPMTSLALLRSRHLVRDAQAMPDRPFPAVEALIRRVRRVAASRPDPMYILAQTISMTSAIGADPYAVLGVLIEGAVQTIVEQIPAEQQTETAATLVRLLKDRLIARGIAGDEP
jgi:hypothetical protein